MGKKGRKRKACLGRQGFSLMELCVVVAIIAIIATISLPALLGMRARYQLRSTATDLLSALKQARAEAVKRNAPVAVTFTATSYTVFLDDGGGVATNVANKTQDNANERTLLTTTLQSGITFPAATINFTTAPTSVTEFNSGGLAFSKDAFGADVASDGSIVLVGTGGSDQFRVTLSPTGTATLQSSTDGGVNWQ